MTQENLENEIYWRIQREGRITLIVMHPQTWIDLTKEVFENDGMEIHRHYTSPWYKNIRVLRSLDMVEGLFEVR